MCKTSQKPYLQFFCGFGEYLDEPPFDAYNEATNLFEIIERYKERTGFYPSRILADKIYRNRGNLNFCKERGIRLLGPALGRPPKNAVLDKKQDYRDICGRMEVERKFNLIINLQEVMMAFEEKSFKSFNGKDIIQAWIYKPIRKPRGIVQIVHGFGEHSRRYLHMILKLNEAGFVVVADDHVGHGKTAAESGNWSDWGDKGFMTMAEDEHILRKMVQEEFPELPYFMYGHSMGSMIARSYAATYGDGMDGLLICGTSSIFPNTRELATKLKKLIDEGRGEEIDPSYLGVLFGWMTDRIENPLTPNDWISGDPDVVTDHANDPFNNFTSPPNICSTYDFIMMIETIIGTQWAEKVPASIPVYNIAGDQDPVGLYGEGVYAVSSWLAETGHQVKTKIYSGYRHEIHNYRDIRDEVEDGMIDFINQVIAQS